MIRKYVHILLAVCAAGAVLTAQEAGKKVEIKPGHTATAAQSTGAKTELKFAVTGLTQDNVSKVKDSLTALSFQTYVCPSCKYEKSTAGKCEPCKMDLVAEKKPLFAGATPLPAENAIALTLDQGRLVRLSEIENTLKSNSITIANDKFPIIGNARLIVRGVTEPDVQAIQKSLKDANLFGDVVTSFDKTTNEVHVQVRAGTTPPMRSAVVTAIQSANAKATLADVVWGPTTTSKT